MNALHTDPDTHLAQVAPILDEAITRLGRDDRKAIILRFFEQRDYRSIGEALGTSDDAAQKRVSRALAKLHAQLISRDRKSTRLNSSHQIISYAVFCLKKKNQTICN